MCRRILFVENQFSQFNQIVKILKSVHDKYEIYPKANNSDQEYIRFMDNIRINLDGRYSEQERNNAKDKIEQYIEAKCIEVIIMDYILVGHEEEGNGISLALKLDDEFELPIIFLSGTSRNCKTVEDGLNKLLDNKPWLKIEWIEKGYTGHFLDNKEYIKRYLVTAINRFLGKTTKEMLEEIIDNIELYQKNEIISNLKFLANLRVCNKRLKEEIETIINNIKKGENILFNDKNITNLPQNVTRRDIENYSELVSNNIVNYSERKRLNLEKCTQKIPFSIKQRNLVIKNMNKSFSNIHEFETFLQEVFE